MPFMFLQAIRTTCRLKIISKASCHNEVCSFTLLFRKVQLKNSYLPNSPKKICLRVLIVSSLSFSGREASSGRMWRPPGLSVLFVCQRPLLWLVCPGRTVSQCKNKKKKLSNGGATVNSVFLLCPPPLFLSLYLLLCGLSGVASAGSASEGLCLVSGCGVLTRLSSASASSTSASTTSAVGRKLM